MQSKDLELKQALKREGDLKELVKKYENLQSLTKQVSTSSNLKQSVGAENGVINSGSPYAHSLPDHLLNNNSASNAAKWTEDPTSKFVRELRERAQNSATEG